MSLPYTIRHKLSRFYAFLTLRLLYAGSTVQSSCISSLSLGHFSLRKLVPSDNYWYGRCWPRILNYAMQFPYVYSFQNGFNCFSNFSSIDSVNREVQVIYLIGQRLVGQNWRNFDLVTKILSNENFCPNKNFVQYSSTTVRLSSDKIDKILA